jgi:hypothetical protein
MPLPSGRRRKKRIRPPGSHLEQQGQRPNSPDRGAEYPKFVFNKEGMRKQVNSEAERADWLTQASATNVEGGQEDRIIERAKTSGDLKELWQHPELIDRFFKEQYESAGPRGSLSRIREYVETFPDLAIASVWAGPIIREVGPLLATQASSVLGHSSSQTPLQDELRHSVDFSSIKFRGKSYGLTAGQRAVVKTLYLSWSQGTPDVGLDYLLEEVLESRGSRLIDTFRGSGLWKILIIKGVARDTYRLNLPDKS